MPVKDLVAALPSAWFSDDVRKTAAALPYRDFMTAGLLVDRLLLKNKRLTKLWATSCPTAGSTSRSPTCASAACRSSTIGRRTSCATRSTPSGSVSLGFRCYIDPRAEVFFSRYAFDYIVTRSLELPYFYLAADPDYELLWDSQEEGYTMGEWADHYRVFRKK